MKEDLEKLRGDMNTGFSDLRTEMAKLRGDLTTEIQKMGRQNALMIVAAIVSIVGLLKYLP